MKHMLRLAVLSALLLNTSLVRADDSSCVRKDCLGKCLSKEEAAGKVFPDYCIKQADCYRRTSCARLEDGTCGWIRTPELEACLTPLQTRVSVPQ